MKKNLDLFKFLDNTPNAFCCVENMKEILKEKGFMELFETNSWSDLKLDGKYFVSRND